MTTYYFKMVDSNDGYAMSKVYVGTVEVTSGNGNAWLDRYDSNYEKWDNVQQPEGVKTAMIKVGPHMGTKARMVCSLTESTRQVNNFVGKSSTDCAWEVGFKGRGFQAKVTGRNWRKETE